jgi:hypothetical protein
MKVVPCFAAVLSQFGVLPESQRRSITDRQRTLVVGEALPGLP